MSGAFKRSSAKSQSSGHCQMDNVPYCPACDAPMVKRSVQRGGRTRRQFWGCSNYPMCRITRPLLRT
jgi:restriction system protein